MCFRLCIVLYFTLYSVCTYIYKADFSHVNKNRSWAARPTQDKREPENYQQKKRALSIVFFHLHFIFFFSSACNHNITRVLLHSFFFFFSWPESGDSVTFPRVNLFLLTLFFFLVILFHFEGDKFL